MAYVIRKLVELYFYFNEDCSDPRVREWPMMRNPLQVLGLLTVYLFLVLKWGPNFMKNRKPYDLKWVMIVYNIVQIAVCGQLVRVSLSDCYFNGYNLLCQPVDYSPTPLALKIASYCYVYYALKVIDLLDTVFFVLRKKQNQVSFLHVYHHAGMVLLSWHGVKYLPGGHSVFMGALNSFVHVVMYSYYLLTALNPKYKNNLWWKKYITQLQIIQFFLIASHWMLLYFTSCNYPKFVILVLVPQNTFMFALFTDFYIKAYVKKKPAKAQLAVEGDQLERDLSAPPAIDGSPLSSGKDAPQGIPVTGSVDATTDSKSPDTSSSASPMTSSKVKSN